MACHARAQKLDSFELDLALTVVRGLTNRPEGIPN